jgi:hypothetical protein
MNKARYHERQTDSAIRTSPLAESGVRLSETATLGLRVARKGHPTLVGLHAYPHDTTDGSGKD